MYRSESVGKRKKLFPANYDTH